MAEVFRQIECPLSKIKKPSEVGAPQPDCPLLSLNYSSLLRILSLLPDEDLGNVRLACKSLRFVVDENRLLTRKVDILITDVKRRQASNLMFSFFTNHDFKIHIAPHNTRRYIKSYTCEGPDATFEATNKVAEKVSDPYVVVGRILFHEMSLTKVKARRILNLLQQLPRINYLDFDSVFFNEIDVNDIAELVKYAGGGRNLRFGDCARDAALAAQMKHTGLGFRELNIGRLDLRVGDMNLLILAHMDTPAEPFELEDIAELGFISVVFYHSMQKATKAEAFAVGRNAIQHSRTVNIRIRALDPHPSTYEENPMAEPQPVERYERDGRVLTIHLKVVHGLISFWDISTQPEINDRLFHTY